MGTFVSTSHLSPPQFSLLIVPARNEVNASGLLFKHDFKMAQFVAVAGSFVLWECVWVCVWAGLSGICWDWALLCFCWLACLTWDILGPLPYFPFPSLPSSSPPPHAHTHRGWGRQNQEKLSGVSIAAHHSVERTEWWAARSTEDHVWEHRRCATERRTHHWWAFQ